MRRADSKKPSRRGRAGPDKDFLGKFKKQPVLLFARDTLVAIGREESKKIMVGGADQ